MADATITSVVNTPSDQIATKAFIASTYEPAITAGTSSQVLLGDKSLADSTEVGGVTLVETASPSASNSFSISGLSNGKYRLVYSYIQNTNAGNLYIRFSGETGNYYILQGIRTNGTNSYVTNSGAVGNFNPTGPGATYPVLVEMTISCVGAFISVNIQTTAKESTTIQHYSQAGVYTKDGNLTSIDFSCSAGTMTGEAKLYKLN